MLQVFSALPLTEHSSIYVNLHKIWNQNLSDEADPLEMFEIKDVYILMFLCGYALVHVVPYTQMYMNSLWSVEVSRLSTNFGYVVWMGIKKEPVTFYVIFRKKKIKIYSILSIKINKAKPVSRTH